MEKIVVYKLETDVSFLDFDSITKKKFFAEILRILKKENYIKKSL
ncbi:hypothetical protein LEP1GSC020_3309 [Leptospira interrogans serovar Grippotyphosa str. 2006006986]|nr:hypothetical protein LEP1GSC009_0616 [Leptospira interrogans serovar Grippotyphosa str. Andaman]EKP83556.1 hypothetical protein LEP1GSC020_3309 [Leptospira interrogans serovar Grippotyphosa str. 2006006986]EMJ45922.1 hypothetical protein LEP1GSC111_0424 [Leptospira interrogans str. UT126]EMN54274.1 hypothetical protein LEP1GSC089_4472 [Leptospira interrogans serovar Autumnalis str. LP101]EMN67789.1 hypothetical protein LEP1GSC098_0299 [Leptospira interrogans serovar Grippotyphosa str. UI 084